VTHVPKLVAGFAFVAILALNGWTQAGRTLNAGDTLYPGWADSSGGIGINPSNPGAMCCWNIEKAMKFNSVNFGTTPYKFMILNYASGEPGCSFVPSLDAPKTTGGGGTSILDNPSNFDAMLIAGSGGWGVNCKARVRLKPVTGTHPLYLYVGRCGNWPGGTMDLNWFIFTNDSTTPVYWDWSLPVDIPVKPGTGPATSVTNLTKNSPSLEFLSVSRSGVEFNITEPGRSTMQILSLSGQLITQKRISGPVSTMVPLASSAPGVYMVRLISENKTVSRSFVLR